MNIIALLIFILAIVKTSEVEIIREKEDEGIITERKK